MASNVQEIMELIDNLTPDEKKLIYKKMNDEITEQLLGFLDTMNERAEKLPISIDEITKEVEEVRSTNFGKYKYK
jgi:Trp operon repressor